MLILHGLLKQVLVEIVEAKSIKLRDSKVHDYELKDIVDHCTTEIVVFEFHFFGY